MWKKRSKADVTSVFGSGISREDRYQKLDFRIPDFHVCDSWLIYNTVRCSLCRFALPS